MSAEPRLFTSSDAWTEWENQVVNGAFPLRRLLGCSANSAVFLTEYKAENLANAAIKFVRTDTLQGKAQLVQWGTAATLSHPNLVRLFEVGRYRSGGQEYPFVVMEYADQTLAQILHQRALGPDEVRELLRPTLDALAFLHRNQRVHSRLNPSNFLAVNDRLKLASDNVVRADHSVAGIARTSAYDPPEMKDRGVSTAGDIWSLGMTLVEALTQWTWSDQQCETASLPANFPAPFVGMVRRCLSLTPANRPTAIELDAPFRPAPLTRSTPEPQPSVPKAAPRETAPPQSAAPKRRLSLSAIAAALLISLAVWGVLRLSSPSQADLQPSAVPAPSPVAPAIAESAESNSRLSSPISRPPPPPTTASPSVLHEVTPDVPPAISQKIKGRIYVTVRVLVDPSGAVVGVLPDNPGSSKYFARLAENAAREWQFAPADNQSARVWLLRFEFTRGGVAARAIAQ